MLPVHQARKEIEEARGDCIAVRTYAINDDQSNIEAEIDPELSKFCSCEYCKRGDLTGPVNEVQNVTNG